MKCQRCGTCCVYMLVVIMGEVDGRLKAFAKPDGVRCPLLSFDNGLACCLIHNIEEYEGSPCHVYGNSNYDIDYLPKKGKPCRIGEFKKKNGCIEEYKKLEKIELSELEDCGEWPNTQKEQ